MVSYPSIRQNAKVNRLHELRGDKMKILLIEDSRFLRIAVERTLTRAGYLVTGVADGREGLQAARTSPPALILLDMMLPGLEGTGVLKALKEDASTAQIPVIVLTGLPQRNEAKLKHDGAAAYIEKSSLKLEENADALIHCIESVLARSSAVSGSIRG
jgi:CheY-like chemotaxis protein